MKERRGSEGNNWKTREVMQDT